ncbi:hypothetical protein Tco_1121975 [Tanacetum coccineum]|uniref:Uncharacterized protein n=1 Tax=Tanacetum coccineum TaxID=301880 RepID=A0ABQ5J0L8_9ASTR
MSSSSFVLMICCNVGLLKILSSSFGSPVWPGLEMLPQVTDEYYADFDMEHHGARMNNDEEDGRDCGQTTKMRS